MSKSAFRKEIATMTDEQLRQMLLDAYDASPVMKEYFDFFLNPDVEAKLDKARKLVIKELNRTHWGTSNARVTVFKKIIKDFAGLKPGAEAELDMMMLVLRLVAGADRYLNLKPTHERFIATLAQNILKWADKNQMTAEAVGHLTALTQSSELRPHMRNFIIDSMNALQL